MSKIREEYSENLESQYRRLERIYKRVIQNFNEKSLSKSSQEILDCVYEFFISCYHLRESIKKDDKVSADIKRNIPLFEDKDDKIEASDSKNSLLICRDLCNKNKHGKLDEKYRPNDVNTKINIMGGTIFSVPIKELKIANREKMAIHLKEEDGIYIGNFSVLFRGREYKLSGVIEGCMFFWRKFFEENDLLVPRSTPRKN